MISDRTLKVWADEDGLHARAAVEREHSRQRYRARYEAAFNALAAMDTPRRIVIQARLDGLDGPGCRSGTLAFMETLNWLQRHGIAEANQIFAHDREQLARMFAVPAMAAE